ncbi:hypothetical protein GCM10027435_10860 [Haloparvum alkalitolerans]|uniref:DUF7854 family protein n=1 Tax=Haloparvum alkalitolerans TaxID=1042953 RepID=UPI003CF024FC
MDRISAIRNIEDAIRSFEDGERDLSETERRVASILRTYATEFDGDGDVFRAVGDPPADGTVVVAPSKPAARERVRERASIRSGADDDRIAQDGDCSFEIERV